MHLGVWVGVRTLAQRKIITFTAVTSVANRDSPFPATPPPDQYYSQLEIITSQLLPRWKRDNKTLELSPLKQPPAVPKLVDLLLTGGSPGKTPHKNKNWHLQGLYCVLHILLKGLTSLFYFILRTIL